jgi:hypothetical protein
MTVVEPGAGKVDRGEVFLEYTKSICPRCKTVIDAEVNVRDNRVILRKRCPDHGTFEALVYSDAELYLAQQRFNKPGTIPLEYQTQVKDGCPLDCGLCPEHKQHACLGIIEVNTGCNLDCPICFADSGHQPDGYSLTLDQVEFMLDRFVAAEGSPEVVQFSGGEPTIHPQILDFIALAQAKGIRSVMLNTNGIRIARDRRFAEALAELRPHAGAALSRRAASTAWSSTGSPTRASRRCSTSARRCSTTTRTTLLPAAGSTSDERSAQHRHGRDRARPGCMLSRAPRACERRRRPGFRRRRGRGCADPGSGAGCTRSDEQTNSKEALVKEDSRT